MGVHFLQAYDMTPKELTMLANARIEEVKMEQESRIQMAYMTAYWAAQWFSKRKPKPLGEILGKPKAKAMTDEDMFNEVLKLHKALGGE